jgi:hypothetical protein
MWEGSRKIYYFIDIGFIIIEQEIVTSILNAFMVSNI